MKRLFALIMSISILLGASSALAASTEENPSADEPMARLDLCLELYAKLEPEQSGSLMPLLRYNDWCKIPANNRKAVASVIKSGLFVPDGASFKPFSTISSADMDVLALDLSLFGLASNRYSYAKGNVTGIRKNNITLHYSGQEHQFDYSDCLFLDSEELVTDMQLECLADSDGKLIVAWASRKNAMSVYTVQKGNFYYSDTDNEKIIINNIKIWINTKWVATPNERYITAAVCDRTKITCDGMVLSPNDLNDIKYLDKEASFIIGEQNGEKYLLYMDLQ